MCDVTNITLVLIAHGTMDFQFSGSRFSKYLENEKEEMDLSVGFKRISASGLSWRAPRRADSIWNDDMRATPVLADVRAGGCVGAHGPRR